MEQKYNFNGLGPVPPPPRISGGELLSFSGSAGVVVQNEPVSVGTVLPQAIATQTKYPFDVLIKSSTEINFVPGTINGLIPTNMYDNFTYSSSGTYIYKITAVTDGVKVISASIKSGEPNPQTPVPFALPAAFDVGIAIIVDGTPFRIPGNGPITVNPVPLFTTDRLDPAPGKFPYLTYYGWSV